MLRLTFAEGRKHEVKRYCEALGHRVRRLRRVAFGPLRLGDLPPGRVPAADAARGERAARRRERATTRQLTYNEWGIACPPRTPRL